MKKILQNDNNAALIASEYLKEGKVIAFACDTVYGLAADASNYNALEKLYNLKKRDQNKPLAVFFKDLNQAEKYLYFDRISKKIAQNFLPGSLTLVLKKRMDTGSSFAKNLNQKNDFLGFRIVKNDFVEQILDNFPGILAVTSANISGQKAAIDAIEVEKEFARRTKRPVDRSNLYSVQGIQNVNQNALENIDISEFMNQVPVAVEPPPRTASVIGINVNDRNNLNNVNLLNIMNRRPVEPPPRTESVIGLSETNRNNTLENVNLSEFGYVAPVVRRPRARTTRTGRTGRTARTSRARNQFNQAANFANFPRLPPPEGRVPVAHYRPIGNSNTEDEYGSPVASPRARPALAIRGTNTTTMARNTQIPPAPPSSPMARRNRRTRRNK